MPVKARFAPAAGLLLTILSSILIAVLPASFARLAFSLLLICFLPGWGAVEGLFALYGRRPQLSERLLFGWGAGYVVTVVGGLWLYYAFGRLSLAPLLALYTVVGLAGFGLAWLRSSGSSAPASSAHTPAVIDVVCLAGLLALAAYLIFYSLSYADFRGDEAEVVLRAVEVIRGAGQPILTHTKGPAEVLLAAAGSVLNGDVFDEFSARLPFSLAGWLAVAGAFVLGYGLFGRRVALIGGALLTVNGWLVTHGHLAQYQDLVLLLSILAVWCYVRFYEDGAPIYHLLGTLFLATAALSHYEGLAAAPAILYLLILGLKRWGSPNESVGWPLAVSLAAGAAVVLSFYVPFILNPAVAGAQSTLAKRFGGNPPYDNWDVFYIDALSFNSIYYTLGVGVALLGGTLLGIRRVVSHGRRGMLAAAGALPLLLLSWTGLLPPWYALLIYLILMGLFLLSRRVSVFVKAMLLWILLPFGLYLFVVARPGNHFYIFMPPLMLLAALALDKGLYRLEAWDSSVRRWVLPAAVGGLLVLYGLSAWYEQLLFVRTDLEYMLTYPQHRQPAFWTDPRFPYDIRIGWGYPYRLGWQTIAELYRSGQLAGDWYGTDENNSILWYTLGWPRNPCYPRYFILSEIGYNDPPLKVPQDTIDRYYALRAVVRVNGQARLRLYEFSPLGNQSQTVIYYDEPASYPTPYRQEMLRGDVFPATPLSPPRRFKPHPDMLARMADAYGDPRIVQVKDEATLLGYDVDDTWAMPGGVLLLTLHWQADHNLIFSYKVFTHVADGDRALAQADSEPGCGELPTNRWVAGDQIIDRHAIFLPADMPPGDYSLQVGMYEARTDLRMDVLDSAGNPAGNSLLLNSVTIRPKR
jgi:4-amino-4-deoxy-L-arabinose transferase-like glycosyltransferase